MMCGAVGTFVALIVGFGFHAVDADEKRQKAKIVGRGGQVIIEACIREKGPWDCLVKLSDSLPATRGVPDIYIAGFHYFASASDVVGSCTLRVDQCGARMIESGAFSRSETAVAIEGARS
jgi:hypothetical protein